VKRPSLKERLNGRDGLFQVSSDLPRVVELDAAAIAPNPDQPRVKVDPAGIKDLADSIERHGLLQPILVRRGEGGFVLVAGQRRLLAFKELGRATVPAIVTSGDPAEIALIENLQREALDPFEEAAAIRRLMERNGYTQAEVGAAIGKKQNTVSALLALERLPERIRAEYPTSDARVSKSWLVELAGVQDEEEQLRLWDLAKQGLATVRAVRAARKTVDGAGEGRPEVRKQEVNGRGLRSASRRLLDGLDGVAPDTVRADAELAAALYRLRSRLDELLAE
jgi:ParB family chromosome partitioning protein